MREYFTALFFSSLISTTALDTGSFNPLSHCGMALYYFSRLLNTQICDTWPLLVASSCSAIILHAHLSFKCCLRCLELFRTVTSKPGMLVLSEAISDTCI